MLFDFGKDPVVLEWKYFLEWWKNRITLYVAILTLFDFDEDPIEQSRPNSIGTMEKSNIFIFFSKSLMSDG